MWLPKGTHEYSEVSEGPLIPPWFFIGTLSNSGNYPVIPLLSEISPNDFSYVRP